MNINPEQQNKEIIKQIAQLMCVAARTAPKACGIDNITTAIISGTDKNKLVALLKKLSKEKDKPFFIRDAENLRIAMLAVIVGTKLETLGLNYCGFCGKEQSCADLAKSNGMCSYNPLDLGIAIGSAVSVANAHHVDNRVMYSVGYAAIKSGLLGKSVKIAFGIPLSISGKNPYFDRK